MKKKENKKINKKTAPKKSITKTSAKKPAKASKSKSVSKPAKNSKVLNAYVISEYFGFNKINNPVIDKEDFQKSDSLRRNCNFRHDHLTPTEELIALVKSVKDKFKMENPSPVLTFSEGYSTNPNNKIRMKPGEKHLSLHVIGTPKSISEALLIKTTLCILESEGYKDVSLEINNVGGKDSLAQFMREFTNYYRKNISELNSNCRQLFKDGPHALVSCAPEIKDPIRDNAPSPLNYLSESNRNHFKEVIEFLETQEIPYKINKDILGEPSYSTHTVFTIIDKKSGKILATGTRYNYLAKKSGLKSDIPAAGVTIRLKKPKSVPASKLKNKSKTKFFFIQIGFEAKLKGLVVLDELRKAGIAVEHVYIRDKLSNQLKTMNKFNAPYTILMGQKEAYDDSVVVRDTATNSQKIVKVAELVSYLKKLK